MYRMGLAIVVGLLGSSHVRAEEVIGKVQGIDAKAMRVDLNETGIGKKEDVLTFTINKGASIEEQSGDKRVALPNGLKDIRVGDYLKLGTSSDRGTTYVIRYRKDPRKN